MSILSPLCLFLMVPGAGIEPAWPQGQRILSPQRLPVPPPGHRTHSGLYDTNQWVGGLAGDSNVGLTRFGGRLISWDRGNLRCRSHTPHPLRDSEGGNSTVTAGKALPSPPILFVLTIDTRMPSMRVSIVYALMERNYA